MTRLRELSDWTSGWFDPVLAVVFLIACEVEVSADVLGDHRHGHWPLAANIVLVAGLCVPIAWRRRAPLCSACMVVAFAVMIQTWSLADVENVYAPLFAIFIPMYSVAAYSTRRRAQLGLAAYICAFSAALTISSAPGPAWVLVLGAGTGSWVVGRVMRNRRSMAAELIRTGEQIASEHVVGERLAVAEQRSRIVTELQALVAASVSEMIVQAQATQSLLDLDPDQADVAMATLEKTGRQALVEMRRILGVLRHPDHAADLAPQPGIGQISALVEQARQDGRPVALSVKGEPGPVPASVDVGLYRLIQDALASMGGDGTQPVAVEVRFGSTDLALQIAHEGPGRLQWPTPAMSERVALCQGDLDVDVLPSGGERLLICLPRLFDGALS
jgi:signal transduction histidine kinase